VNGLALEATSPRHSLSRSPARLQAPEQGHRPDQTDLAGDHSLFRNRWTSQSVGTISYEVRPNLNVFGPANGGPFALRGAIELRQARKAAAYEPRLLCGGPTIRRSGDHHDAAMIRGGRSARESCSRSTRAWIGRCAAGTCRAGSALLCTHTRCGLGLGIGRCHLTCVDGPSWPGGVGFISGRTSRPHDLEQPNTGPMSAVVNATLSSASARLSSSFTSEDDCYVDDGDCCQGD
jgi:hypothetical protein